MENTDDGRVYNVISVIGADRRMAAFAEKFLIDYIKTRSIDFNKIVSMPYDVARTMREYGPDEDCVTQWVKDNWGGMLRSDLPVKMDIRVGEYSEQQPLLRMEFFTDQHSAEPLVKKLSAQYDLTFNHSLSGSGQLGLDTWRNGRCESKSGHVKPHKMKNS